MPQENPVDDTTSDGMQAILKPISHPELGEVAIDDALFCIGRDGEAFAKLSDTLAGRLSRRHARLFEQDGVIYIVDLGSRNGTFVNGQPVATQPQELKPGDLIDFAGELTYRLAVDGYRSRDAANQPDVRTLTLQATGGEQGPDSLVITAFPFLISKQADAFANYQQRAPEELDYLSRRHAHIFRHHGRLFVEDLGSTNGTFVDGQRLDEKAVELRDSQTLAFGGDYFVYRVTLTSEQAATRILTTPPPTQPDDSASDKTTFVTAATSFLDIFCAEDAETDTPENAAADAASKEPARGVSRDALWRGGLLAVAVVAIIVAGTYWALLPSPSERMTALIEQERFDDALSLARASESAADSDAVMSRLALRALAAKTLPTWLRALDEADFDTVAAVVDAEVVDGEPLAIARDYLGLLRLIGQIESVVAQRGGLAIRLRLFDEESSRLEALVADWRAPHPDKRKVSERLLASLPPARSELAERYRTAYGRAASHVRTLDNKLKVRRAAEQQVTALLNTHLSRGSLDPLADALGRLATRYAQIAGFDALRQDLASYQSIDQAVRQKRELEAARLLSNTEFRTAPFAEQAARLAQTQLPSVAFLDAYAASQDLLRAGNVDAARARLKSLFDSPWQSIAQREIDRVTRVEETFAQLQSSRGASDYDTRVLAFYHALDDDRDQHYRRLLRDDYEQSLARTLQKAEQAAALAAQAWTQYQRLGRISSTQRLASSVGKAFTERAAALSEAAAQADRASEAYASTNTTPPVERRTVLAAIRQEVALQLQSLDELVGVLDGAALNDKRALLPRRSQ